MDDFHRFEYVAAAYNGGPTRVRRWVNESPTNEIEEWVEGYDNEPHTFFSVQNQGLAYRTICEHRFSPQYCHYSEVYLLFSY